MLQIIKCECGESTMQHGRCISCGIPRPSSKEVLQRIKNLNKELDNSVGDLSLALELEKTKASREGRGCFNCKHSDIDPLDATLLCHSRKECSVENREGWEKV